MDKLVPIEWTDDYKEFDFSLTPDCDDRIATQLILDDYNWMNYTFETVFPTKTQGILNIKIEYVGSSICTIKVEQIFKEQNKKYIHRIDFSVSLFQDFIKDYMLKHIKNWDETFAFNGGFEAVQFFNRILRDYETYYPIKGFPLD